MEDEACVYKAQIVCGQDTGCGCTSLEYRNELYIYRNEVCILAAKYNPLAVLYHILVLLSCIVIHSLETFISGSVARLSCSLYASPPSWIWIEHRQILTQDLP